MEFRNRTLFMIAVTFVIGFILALAGLYVLLNHHFEILSTSSQGQEHAQFTAEHNQLYLLLFSAFIMGAGLFVIVWRQMHTGQNVAVTASQTERRNELFAAAIEATPAGVVITDPSQQDNPIVFVNKAFTTMTGYAPEEVIGRNCRLLQGIHTDRETTALLAEKIRARQPVSATILNYRKDGGQFWNDLRISPVFDRRGSLMNFIALQVDTTGIRATQEALKLAKEQAERATSVKSDFMAMISHEIRTPINGVLGTLSLLKDTPLTEEQSHLTETALSSGQTLLTVVNDILDFTKIEAGKLAIETTNFDLLELISSVAELTQPAAQQKSLDVHFHIDPLLPRMVAGDPTRVRQILLNLATNAVKFTERGSVTIQANNLLTHSGEAGEQCVVRFEVIDTGIGIDQEGQTKLFTEFNQLDPSIARRYGGTGLGLAICKRLVAMMEGEIGVESRLGAGSKFWFVLPLNIVVALTKPATDSTTVQAIAPGRILIVEDHPTNQMVLAGYLRKAGHETAIAEHGAVALDMVQAKPYDLVFMDISMPVMDGLTATRKIRDLGGPYATMPILAMTAMTMPGDKEKCLAAGMNDFISKPVDPKILQQALQRWMKPGQHHAPAAAIEPLPAMDNAPPPGAPILDNAVLEQMQQDIGADMVKQLITVFHSDLKKRHAILAAAIAKADWSAVALESHALKSSSASCGLMEFSCLMQEIEMATQNNDTGKVQSLAKRIDPCAKAAQAALSTHPMAAQ